MFEEDPSFVPNVQPYTVVGMGEGDYLFIPSTVAYIVMAYIVMAYVVMAYVVMARIVICTACQIRERPASRAERRWPQLAAWRAACGTAVRGCGSAGRHSTALL